MMYRENEGHNVEGTFTKMETITGNIPIDKEVKPQPRPSTKKRYKTSKQN